MMTDAQLEFPRITGEPQEPAYLRIRLESYPSARAYPGATKAVTETTSFLVIEQFSAAMQRQRMAVLPLEVLWSFWPHLADSLEETIKATINAEATRLAEGAARKLVADLVGRMTP